MLKFVSERVNTEISIFLTIYLDLYYLAFPEDRTLNKALVYGVFILESVQVILLLIDGMYTYRPFVVLSHGPGIQPMQFVVQPSKVTMIIWTSIPVLGTTGMVLINKC